MGLQKFLVIPLVVLVDLKILVDLTKALLGPYGSNGPFRGCKFPLGAQLMLLLKGTLPHLSLHKLRALYGSALCSRTVVQRQSGGSNHRPCD